MDDFHSEYQSEPLSEHDDLITDYDPAELKVAPMPTSANRLKQKILFDKFKGIIWGCALGDWTESKQKCLKHRGCLSDHMVLLLDSAYFDENNVMRIDNKLFASKLVLWRYNGFPELGDTAGIGAVLGINGSLTAKSLHSNIETLLKLTAHPKYTMNPQTTSIHVYESLGGSLKKCVLSAPAPNGALMRIAPLALSEDYLSEVTEHTLITHYDSRCVVSCLLQCDIIRHILKNYNKSPPLTNTDITKMAKDVSFLLDKEFLVEFNKYINIALGALLDARLDNAATLKTDLFEKLNTGAYDVSNKNGYTFVALAVMIWAVRAAIAGYNYETVMKTIVTAGGDADTNAAIAGAVLGAYFGYSALPQAWVNATPNQAWLDKKILNFLSRNSTQ